MPPSAIFVAGFLLLHSRTMAVLVVLFHSCCFFGSSFLFTDCPLPGVAEQFAIAEAKLRAWSSIDGEDSTDDSYDEDLQPSMDHSQPAGGS